jgi:hypothetical protein
MRKLIILIVAAMLLAACKKDVPAAPAPSTPAAQSDKPVAAGANVTLHTTATVKETLVLRSKPDAKSERAHCTIKGKGCSPYDNYCTGEGSTVLTSGMEVKITARTEKKMKVAKWENYWYRLQGDDDAITCPNDTWVYGQFLKVQ